MVRTFRSWQRSLERNTQRDKGKQDSMESWDSGEECFQKENKLLIISDAFKRSSNLWAEKVHLDLVARKDHDYLRKFQWNRKVGVESWIGVEAPPSPFPSLGETRWGGETFITLLSCLELHMGEGWPCLNAREKNRGERGSSSCCLRIG